MNTDRLHLLADTVEKHSKQFRMLTWTNACGTPACIAGFAAALAMDSDPREKLDEHDARIPITAAEWLGLPEDEADELFSPAFVDWDQITADKAAACLRYLSDTGKVDWDRAGVDLEKALMVEDDLIF